MVLTLATIIIGIWAFIRTGSSDILGGMGLFLVVIATVGWGISGVGVKYCAVYKDVPRDSLTVLISPRAVYVEYGDRYWRGTDKHTCDLVIANKAHFIIKTSQNLYGFDQEKDLKIEE